ncbi:MAG TPA: type VI secretion system baseplate subunit TssG [Ramlibacter sp.]|uniref:type VI secretion system baseplate subunit TssG n=1 Tax=Ramlibacter sp. TaxID=1917967 RepID=UPI002D80CEB0|nr:type VI secretion system baseplate subunit TssG [Ramlibacter sp.]HET8747344.1 type VI secretion system baseplate subunit TssG [Ramlibacter sp.]
MKREPVPPASSFDAARRAEALAALFSALEREPRAHDFFAVLRQVEALRPEWPRLGRALRPSQEALRLGEEPELDFAPAALASFARRAPTPTLPQRGRETEAAPRLGVRFFGLLGPQGPMPLHFTEYVRERLRYRGDATLARFLDLFHHRLLLLFYRAWAQAQPAVQHDRPGEDRFAAWLGAACGEPDAPQGARALPENARLFQAGLLGARSRHAEGLAKLLSNHFGVPVAIEPHIAHWLDLAAEDRTRLGSRNARLGVDSACGRKLRDRQYKFRIALGPLTLAQYESFLPGGTAWPALEEWVRHYTGLDLRWDVQLTLARAHVPAPCLGSGIRLGVSAWIGRRAQARDRGDLRLRPHTSSLLRPGGCHA